jgi:toxin-antitoxin system PIN domain toxin
VILPDVNLLVHAYNADSPGHERARAWWESAMNGSAPVALVWAVILGFLRIATHRMVLDRPMPVEAAVRHVRSWIARPQVTLLHPGDRHAEILFGLLESVGTAGNLTTDAHVAAIAIEHGAEVYTTDADFARFRGLRWKNPLTGRSR